MKISRDTSTNMLVKTQPLRPILYQVRIKYTLLFIIKTVSLRCDLNPKPEFNSGFFYI